MLMRDAVARLQIAADLCSARLGGGDVVVWAACEVLAAGGEGEDLAILAGMPMGERQSDILGLLPSVMAELDIDFHKRDSPGSGPAGVRAIAQEVLADRLSPRAAVGLLHSAFCWGSPEAECFEQCDLAYSELECIAQTVEEIDAEVRALCTAAAQQLPDPLRRWHSHPDRSETAQDPGSARPTATRELEPTRPRNGEEQIWPL